MAPIPEATWENRPDAALICFVTYTRARGALLRDQTDLLEPPGRRQDQGPDSLARQLYRLPVSCFPRLT
jgi:hypothetical protein